MKDTQIAMIQDHYSVNEEQKNIEKIKQSVKRAKELSPDLGAAVLPEMCVSGYQAGHPYAPDAGHAEDSHYDDLSAFAKELNIYLFYGFAEAIPEEKQVYNAVNVVGPTGKLAGTYRKIHCTSGEPSFKKGSTPLVLSTEIGRIGVMICWDLAFPEHAAFLANEGADMLVAPSAWEEPYEHAFHGFASSRARDHSLYVAAVNQTGESGPFSFFGESSLYAPDGRLQQQLHSGKPDIGSPSLDGTYQHSCRQTFYTMNQERRTDIFS